MSTSYGRRLELAWAHTVFGWGFLAVVFQGRGLRRCVARWSRMSQRAAVENRKTGTETYRAVASCYRSFSRNGGKFTLVCMDGWVLENLRDLVQVKTKYFECSLFFCFSVPVCVNQRKPGYPVRMSTKVSTIQGTTFKSNWKFETHCCKMRYLQNFSTYRISDR